MPKLTNCLFGSLVFALSVASLTAQTINLAGEWQFSLDRANSGVQDNWFNQILPDKITLPRALQSQNYGDEISTKTPWILSLYDRNWLLRDDYKNYTRAGNVKVPFLSQPPRHYIGPAWYERDITIAAAWQGKRVVLFLERSHWESTVWVDGKKIGSNRSLVAPHEYDLGQLPAGKHRVSIRVDNSLLMAYRPDAHSVSDSLGGSWNGIVGKIELQATAPVWIDDAQVYPNVEKRTATVKLKIGGGQAGSGTLTANGKTNNITWNADGATKIEIQFPQNAQTWSEFHPVLQKISLQLKSGKNVDTREVSFGFSEFKASGNQFIQNGRLVYLRGTHHGGDFALTGYPPTDVAYWKKIFQTSKNWGFNHFRFHSFCPPEAAFQAADELRIYIQPEPGMWNEVSPDTPMEKMLYEETERIIRAYGNHPSFVMLDKLQGRANFQVSSYDLYAPRWATPPDTEFAGQDKPPAVAGEFVWTGFDYLGEPTPYDADSKTLLNFTDPAEQARAAKTIKAGGKIVSPSRSSYFGIVDLCGFKKDRFYIYQARWRSELPMAHILPDWNWPDRVGQITPVHVYTSGDEAELFLNGKSLGRKKLAEFQYRFRWDDVVYQPGELRVVAFKNGKKWAEDVVKTTDAASQPAMAADQVNIKADGVDLAYITVRITDKNGLTVPRTKNRIKFEIAGAGEIVAVDNGDATDLESFQSTNRRAYNGMALVIIRSIKGRSGKITLKASAAGLKASVVSISAGR